MSLLVDTNVLSEVRKGARANPNVRSWLEALDDGDIFISALSLGELRRGVESIRKKDGSQAASLERWLNRLATTHASRIVPIDVRVAEAWGRLMATRTGSLVDTLLAATALVHGLVLVTRNVKDVAWTGVTYLDPFEPPA